MPIDFLEYLAVLRLSALLLVSLFVVPAPAFALAGELDAVEQHCGTPLRESQEVSVVTDQAQRTLYYPNDVALHFQPMDEGWSFTTGWRGGLPISREALEQSLPCFRDAMLQVAAANPAIQAADPGILNDTVVDIPFYNQSTFGIPHFWLIVALAFFIVVAALIPKARKRRLARREAATAEVLAARKSFRKPEIAKAIPPVYPKHTEPDMYK